MEIEGVAGEKREKVLGTGLINFEKFKYYICGAPGIDSVQAVIQCVRGVSRSELHRLCHYVKSFFLELLGKLGF